MSIRELEKGKKYKIELFLGRNGSKKIMHYEIVNGGKKEAELRENELKLQIKSNTFIKKTRLTVQDLMNEYLDFNKGKWSPKTYVSNVHWVDNINKALGHVYLKDLNVKLLEAFYKSLRDMTKTVIDKATAKPEEVPKYSDKTIQHHYVLINGALNRAIKWGYVNYNVNQKIEKPKARKKEIECYTKEDITKLLSALEAEPLKYKAIVMLALDSGCRRGEITGLTWDDVNFEEQTITINKTTQYVKELGIYEKSTKSQNSDRIVYLTTKTTSILKQYKLEQNKNRMLLGSKWGNSTRIFTTDYGKDMHPDTPSQILEKIIKKHNLKRISFHGLRHTCASLLISEGIQHQIISRKLGHSSVLVTDSIYSHFTNDEFKEASRKFEDIFNVS